MVQNANNRPPLGYIIHDRPAFAYVEIHLQPGEQVLADGRAMIWMDMLQLQTQVGDCGAGCKRWCAGESLCQNTYTNNLPNPAKVSFGFKLPGDMLPFAVTPGKGWMIQSGAFVCGTTNLKIDAQWAGCSACMCGGEGPFFTRVNVQEEKNELGMFFAGGYGAIVRHDIGPGKEFYIDGGLFFASNENTEISLALPGGCMGWCYGGEGFVMKFQGPITLYSQNRNPHIWKRVLAPKQGKKKKGQSGAGASAGML